MIFRTKRQHHGGRQFGNPGFSGPGFGQNNFQQPYGSSQSTAQSNSHSNAFGPYGSQNANALAAAQGKLYSTNKIKEYKNCVGRKCD